MKILESFGLDSKENNTFDYELESSFRGYGLTKIWLRPDKNPENILSGKPIKKRIENFTDPITMTLISDTI